MSFAKLMGKVGPVKVRRGGSKVTWSMSLSCACCIALTRARLLDSVALSISSCSPVPSRPHVVVLTRAPRTVRLRRHLATVVVAVAVAVGVVVVPPRRGEVAVGVTTTAKTRVNAPPLDAATAATAAAATCDDETTVVIVHASDRVVVIETVVIAMAASGVGAPSSPRRAPRVTRFSPA